MAVVNLPKGKVRERSPARTALAEGINGLTGLARDLGKAKNALDRATDLRDQAERNHTTAAEQARAATRQHADDMLRAARSGKEVPAFSGARELRYAERDAEEALETAEGVFNSLQAEYQELQEKVASAKQGLLRLARAVVADEAADAGYMACEHAAVHFNRQMAAVKVIHGCMQHSADRSYQRMRAFTENAPIGATIEIRERSRVAAEQAGAVWRQAIDELLLNPDALLPVDAGTNLPEAG